MPFLIVTENHVVQKLFADILFLDRNFSANEKSFELPSKSLKLSGTKFILFDLIPHTFLKVRGIPAAWDVQIRLPSSSRSFA